MKSVDSIIRGLTEKESYHTIARKIFLSFPTHAFFDREEVEFRILDDVSKYFRVPITSIQVSGSSKTGYSPYKKREFKEGISDLDLAIVNNSLFTYYSEKSHKITKGYSDLTKFPRNKVNGESQVDFFLSNLNSGFFRPDLMPSSNEKVSWFNFFNELSNRHYKIFKSINAGIYASEYYFESKQIDCIQKFKQFNGIL